MKICKDYPICYGFPAPEVLIRNELKTLRQLKDDPQCVRGDRTDIAPRASLALDRAAQARRVAFEAHYDVTHDGSRMRLLFGADIRCSPATQYEKITYYLGAYRPDVPAACGLQVLRKFHFDHDPQTRRRPSLHMQYAGELSPRLACLGLQDAHLFPKLSEPRIPCAPTSIALLLHLALTEFRDEDARRFTERTEWRGLVRHNEQLMLSWFYRKCGEHFTNSKWRPHLLCERFYND